MTTPTVTALLIAGLIHPPKEKYSLEQLTITVSGLPHPPKVKYSLKPLTITVSGPTHPPKVKYSLKLQLLQIPVKPQRQVRVQTSERSSAHPPRPAVRRPAVPAAQRLPGPPHPPKVKYSRKQQQSTMRAVRQVQERLLGLLPRVWQSNSQISVLTPPRNGNHTQDHA